MPTKRERTTRKKKAQKKLVWKAKRELTTWLLKQNHEWLRRSWTIRKNNSDYQNEIEQWGAKEWITRESQHSWLLRPRKEGEQKGEKELQKTLFIEKEWTMQERASWPLKCITMLLLKTIAIMHRNSHVIITSRISTNKSMSKGHTQRHRSWNKKTCRRKSMINHWRAPTWNMKCKLAGLQKRFCSLMRPLAHTHNQTFTLLNCLLQALEQCQPMMIRSLGFSKQLEFCDPKFWNPWWVPNLDHAPLMNGGHCMLKLHKFQPNTDCQT